MYNTQFTLSTNSNNHITDNINNHLTDILLFCALNTNFPIVQVNLLWFLLSLGTKTLVVHGQNECDIPTQLPVHEDTQFEALLKVEMTFDRNDFLFAQCLWPLQWSSSWPLNGIFLSSNEHVHLFTSSRICSTIVYFLSFLE